MKNHLNYSKSLIAINSGYLLICVCWMGIHIVNGYIFVKCYSLGSSVIYEASNWYYLNIYRQYYLVSIVRFFDGLMLINTLKNLRIIEIKGICININDKLLKIFITSIAIIIYSIHVYIMVKGYFPFIPVNLRKQLLSFTRNTMMIFTDYCMFIIGITFFTMRGKKNEKNY